MEIQLKSIGVFMKVFSCFYKKLELTFIHWSCGYTDSTPTSSLLALFLFLFILVQEQVLNGFEHDETD